MRILGQAIAFAGIFVVMAQQATAADLLAPDRPIAEVVDHYIDETLRKEAVKPAPLADDADPAPPVDARPGRAHPHGGRVAGVRRIDRPREDGPAGRSPDGVAGLRPAPGDRARHDAHGRQQGQPARLPGARPSARTGRGTGSSAS